MQALSSRLTSPLAGTGFGGSLRILPLDRVTKNAVQHMIDMFDSIDIQTAYVTAGHMVNQMQKGLNGNNAVRIALLIKTKKFSSSSAQQLCPRGPAPGPMRKVRERRT